MSVVVGRGSRGRFELPNFIELTPSDDPGHDMQLSQYKRVEGKREVCPIVDEGGQPILARRRYAGARSVRRSSTLGVIATFESRIS